MGYRNPNPTDFIFLDGEAGADGGEGRDPDAIGRVGGLELLELEELRLVRA